MACAAATRTIAQEASKSSMVRCYGTAGASENRTVMDYVSSTTFPVRTDCSAAITIRRLFTPSFM